MNETPILLLTGYLGSGKTTLLNRVLTNKKGIKFAVIVNDIGEVNIDASLIERGGIVGNTDDSLVALQNGCICCTLKMDLIGQIRDIINMKKFDYIVIEASGVCEPEPIARTICSIPMMGDDLIKNGSPKLDCIVTVVDALRLKDEFGCAKNLLNPKIKEEDIENLVIEQIEFCNIILLNKASEVEKHELEKIKEIIRNIQPVATIIECDYGNVDLESILNTNLFDYDSVSGSATWVKSIEGDIEEEEHEHEHDHHHHDEDDEHEHHHHEDEEDEHEHHHHHHDEDEDDEHCHEHEHCHGHEHHHHHHHDEGETEEYGIGTFVYYNRKPFDIGLFDDFVAKHWPNGIIRTKGICYFSEEYDKCYMFEQAGSQVSLKDIGFWYATMPEDELNRQLKTNPGLIKDWDLEYGDRMQKIVFIGQHLNKEEITKALNNCLAN